MTFPEILINVYMDMNMLLAIGILAWFLLCLMLRRAGMPVSNSARLKLLRITVAIALLGPVGVYFLIHTPLLREGGVLSHISLTDYMITLYVQGHIGLDPKQMETLVDLRQWIAGSFGDWNSQPAGALSVLLVGGAVFYGLAFARKITSLNAILKQCHTWKKSGTIQLVLSDTATVPFAARSWRCNYIVLPLNLLSNRADLETSIAHEAQHLRNRDVTWDIFLESLKLLFFWNPAFHLLKEQSDRLRELACDEAVLQRRQFRIRAYCDFLLRASQWSLNTRQPVILATGAAGLAHSGWRIFRKPPELILHHRVAALLGGITNRDHLPVLSGAVFALAGMMLLTAISIHQPVEVSAERLHFSTIANQINMSKSNRKPGYNLIMAY